MSDNLRQLAELLKEGKRQNAALFEPVTPVVEVVAEAPVDLKTFLVQLAEEKKIHKEELREKATEVIPKLGDFFSALSKSKKIVEDTIDAAEEIQPVSPEVSEQIEAVVDAAEEIQQVIEYVEANKEAPVPQNFEEDFSGIRTSITTLEKRLSKEVDLLKKMILSSPKHVVHQTAGGGEVRFAKLDDISLFNVLDGDIIQYDASLQKFVNARPPATTGSTGIPAGSAGQVLVKISNTDYDYEWQDMVIQPTSYTKLIDDSVANVMYIGESAPGSSQGAPAWRIQKIAFDSAGNVDSVYFAATGSFDQQWINRYVLSYS